MERPIDTSFVHSEIAGETVLDRTTAVARMAFGLGPAASGAPLETRCRGILKALAPEVDALRWSRQVHGSDVTAIARSDDRELRGTACVGSSDALVTTEEGVGLMVWTADCVPILLEGPGVVAAIHSGWRGTAADIVATVIGRLEAENGVRPERIFAALGPAISGARYEVGEEVVEALEAVGLEDPAWRRGRHVDLRLFLAGRLRQLGVPASSITVVGPCTASDPNVASYRRDGDNAGRQFSLVYRRRGATMDGRRPRS